MTENSNKKNVKEVQARLLEMLKFFHRYCTENNLRYYLIGGSMLGAVRHKGFIPWDDDIDIGMPREDYNKLATIYENNERFVLETSNSQDQGFWFLYSKLYDISTTLIEKSRYKLVRGIYIDIFPIDGCGNTEKEALKWYKKISNKKTLLKFNNLAIIKEYGSIKNLIIRIVRSLPEFIVENNRLKLEIENICIKKSFYNNVFSGNITGAWGIREIMPTV